MKKLNYLLLFSILAIVLFQTCKPKENLTDNNSNKTTNNKIANNDTITKKVVNNTIVIENKTNANKTKTSNEKKAAENNGSNDTILPILTITETETETEIEYDPDPPVETPMTAPMPQIVTELFPDYEWKLFVNNEGCNKYYSTRVGNRKYGYDVLNDLIKSKYKEGELSDIKLIELFIFLLMHPYDNNMEIISTEKLKEIYRNHFNYKSVVKAKDERIIFYSSVKEGKYRRCFAIKSNRIFKELSIN